MYSYVYTHVCRLNGARGSCYVVSQVARDKRHFLTFQKLNASLLLPVAQRNFKSEGEGARNTKIARQSKELHLCATPSIELTMAEQSEIECSITDSRDGKADCSRRERKNRLAIRSTQPLKVAETEPFGVRLRDLLYRPFEKC